MEHSPIFLDAPIREGASTGGWKRVLVLLDGSALSQWALARGRHILERPGISVTLLRVITCDEEQAKDLGYRMDKRHRKAHNALARLRYDLECRTVATSAKLRFGDPVKEILREIVEGGHDLVIMTTHGRTGLDRILFGSVARSVLQSSPSPLLLFRPLLGPEETLSSSETSEAACFTRLLVPLDGLEMTEEIIPAAEGMARALDSDVYLFRAIHRGSREAAERREAEEHLTRLGNELASLGIRAHVEVRAGNVADEALALIRERRINSVALMTQGRSWLERTVHGDMSEGIIREAGVPILALHHRRYRRSLPAPLLEHHELRVR